MEATHNQTHGEVDSALAGLEADLDLAEMEISSGRLGEARLRFARLSRLQREAPRSLYLRAKATETEDSRRMLASFIRTALDRYHDPLARAYLSAALALCGDRSSALRYLPADTGLNSFENSVRQRALDALGSVPDLPETEDRSLSAIIARKLATDRRSR